MWTNSVGVDQFLEMVRGPIHLPLTLGVRATPDDAEIAASVNETVRPFLATCRIG